MQILLANAKIMYDKSGLKPWTEPQFQSVANRLAMDMAGAILSVVLVQLGQMGDHALVIETEFKTEDDGIKGHFFLVPDPGSLEIILQAVGV